MRFTYQSGQRVLNGFTIKRGVGRGGFGEVYFAVSDGGKEVALKLLSEREVEMRGVRNCLNLKHPNLVHVYDVREDDRGDTWIVMEYVLGESLAQVISRQKGGLPEHLAKEWFLSLSRSVGYLHDQGVVHRDLKPANIFIEAGNLKVGDYGLCKSVSSGVRQTQRVGTVHYMAPEIGSGRYDKGVDIYACGVMLTEMLTGRLPFDGETDNEILMKHLTAEPDLSAVSPALRPVLARALEKNPLDRYASMAEFGRAVEGAAKPAAVLTPIPLSAIPPAPPMPTGAEPPKPAALPVVAPVARPVAVSLSDTPRQQSMRLFGSLGLAAVVSLGIAVPGLLLTSHAEWPRIGRASVLCAAMSAAMLAGAGRRSYRSADSWEPHLRLGAMGLGIGFLAYWLEGWGWPRLLAGGAPEPGFRAVAGAFQLETAAFDVLVGYLMYFGGLFAAGRWWKASAEDRPDRVAFLPCIAAAAWGTVLAFLWPWHHAHIVGGLLPLVLATLVVQAVSPWTPALPSPPKKLRYRPAP